MINLTKEDYITYLKISAPLLAQLKDETRTKVYQMTWELLFGENKEEKLKEHKDVLNEIKEQFSKNLVDHGGEELMYTGKMSEKIFDQFK